MTLNVILRNCFCALECRFVVITCLFIFNFFLRSSLLVANSARRIVCARRRSTWLDACPLPENILRSGTFAILKDSHFYVSCIVWKFEIFRIDSFAQSMAGFVGSPNGRFQTSPANQQRLSSYHILSNMPAEDWGIPDICLQKTAEVGYFSNGQ